VSYRSGIFANAHRELPERAFQNRVGVVPVARRPACLQLPDAHFYSIPGWPCLITPPVSQLNVAETTNTSLDMTAAVAEAAPIIPFFEPGKDGVRVTRATAEPEDGQTSVLFQSRKGRTAI
jgi:hypothetical protein